MENRGSEHWALRHATFFTAIGITIIFMIRFLNALPFSGNTRIFNYETITTLASIFIYNNEPFSFPLGTIKGLTFPYQDANIGNVGGIPLFALVFKGLGKLIPYFRTFDYFILVEIVSCFFTAFFSQKVLLRLGVRHRTILILGALLTATSFLLLTRSAWLMPFCVASFPLAAAWIYAMIITLQRDRWHFGQDLGILLLFPISTLVDNYTLVAILLGTGILVSREFFEYLFGGTHGARNRLYRLLFFCVAGSTLSLFSLYLIGMFPLTPLPNKFTSYDFGMGGRYHVADLFSPWIPVANQVYSFVIPSLWGNKLPFNTDHLGRGQYDGVGYIGTAAIFIWIAIVAAWIFSKIKNRKTIPFGAKAQNRLVIFSPWKKIVFAAFFLFAFSLGYELHILGMSFPKFSGMPAAWLADRFPSLYNIRSTGRLVIFFSFILIFEALRRFSDWFECQIAGRTVSRKLFAFASIGLLATIHCIEILPFLKPIPSQPILPLGNVYSEKQINSIKDFAADATAIFIAPTVMAVDAKWTIEAFSLAYYIGIPSNLLYIARVDLSHYEVICNDLAEVMAGNWDDIDKKYGKVLFTVPIEQANTIRHFVENKYMEKIVGPLSIWYRR